MENVHTYFPKKNRSPIYGHSLERFSMRYGKMALMAATYVLTLVMGVHIFPLMFAAREGGQMEIRQRMLKEQEVVKNTCRKYSGELLLQYAKLFDTEPLWDKLNPVLHTNPELLVSRNQRLVWCKVPKVASTSLVHGLLRVIGEGQLIEEGYPRGLLHTMLRTALPPPQIGEDLSNNTAFLVVRHPFQRILSAYRDRIADRTEFNRFKKFHDLYGRHIIERHRKEPQPFRYRDLPTFWEFVEYLVSTPVWEYNEHWRPYYLICTPCHHHYDVIMHLETIENDSHYLADITGYQYLIPDHLHSTHSDTIYGKNSKSKDQLWSRNKINQGGIPFPSQLREVDGTELEYPGMKKSPKTESDHMEAKFYSKISIKQLRMLYEKYKIDFEMFNYTLKPYDSYVNEQ